MVSAVKLWERPERHTHTDLTDNIWSLMEQCWDHYPWNRPKISSVLGILRDWFVLFFSRWPSANCSIFIISRNGDKLLVPVLPPAPSNWFAQILGEILDLTDQLASIALFGSVGVRKTFVAHTVLDSDRAKAKFGENRHFMRCDDLSGTWYFSNFFLLFFMIFYAVLPSLHSFLSVSLFKEKTIRVLLIS